MGTNHLKRSIVPQSAPSKKDEREIKYLNKDISKMNGWQAEGNKANVFVSLRFVQYSHQCFSAWSTSEMEVFWKFNSKIHDFTWEQIMSQGSKNPKDKVGFAYTIIGSETYPNKDFRDTLDPTTTFFELRANDKIRIHGFRDKSIFYAVWLDKDHSLT